MDSVVHFEIPADDLDRGKKFYADVFGWQVKKSPEIDYTTLLTTEVDEKTWQPKEPGAINGGMSMRDPKTPYPLVTIDVTDIDTTMEKIKKLGGSEVKEKMAVGDMGFVGYFKDSEGNILALWQTK